MSFFGKESLVNNADCPFLGKKVLLIVQTFEIQFIYRVAWKHFKLRLFPALTLLYKYIVLKLTSPLFRIQNPSTIGFIWFAKKCFVVFLGITSNCCCYYLEQAKEGRKGSCVNKKVFREEAKWAIAGADLHSVYSNI
jgi:hypothetical protein